MYQTHARAGVITPFRGVQRPLWPFAVNRDSPQAEGLVHWWPGPPVGGGTLFDLGNGQAAPGTLQGNAAWAAEPEDGGNVLSFDGTNSYIDTGTNTSVLLGGLSAGMVSLWAYPLAAGPVSAESYQGEALCGDASGYWGLYQARISGSDELWAYCWDSHENRVGAAYTVGAWTHLVWLIVGGDLSLYKDGALVGSVACSDVGSDGVVTFGRAYTSGGQYFNGYLRDIRVYNPLQTDPSVIAEMYDPRTRWELYYPLRQRVWGCGTVPSTFVPKQLALPGSVGTALSMSGGVGTALSVPGSVGTSIAVGGSL